MLNWVFSGKKKGNKDPSRKRPSYDKAKEIAANGQVEERRELASYEDLEPELLYYFASDEAPEVRREVARNEGTPLQADTVLVNDVDDYVRCELAQKIGRLVPSLSEDENERLTEMAIDVLWILAHDHLPKVRAIISEEIKLATNIPHEMVKRLAEDVEEIVSGPLLEYSPLLSDHDLLQIIAGGVGNASLIAISSRKYLAGPVVDIVVNFRNVESLRVLLGNQSAKISEETLDKIAVVASGAIELHKPMVDRDNLPVRIIRRIANFVSATLVDRLTERHALDEKLVGELRQAVRRRIDKGDLVETEPSDNTSEVLAEQMYADGTLNDGALIKAIEIDDEAFLRHALILLSGLSQKSVAKMFNSGNAKAVTALCWKAGICMKTAEMLQSRLGRIKESSKLWALDGGGYPMSEEDLDWYIELYT